VLAIYFVADDSYDRILAGNTDETQKRWYRPK
jgi:hypothetical protein